MAELKLDLSFPNLSKIKSDLENIVIGKIFLGQALYMYVRAQAG